jgi:secreted trypsin-like serine protease
MATAIGLKKLGLLALIALSASLAHADDNFIIGGVEIQNGDPILTSTVLLYDGSYLCTGSLIAEDLIVTAAHCVLKPINVKKLHVFFTTSLSQPGAANGALPVVEAIANPNYNPKSDVNNNDIAMIKINGPLPSGYGPAQLMSRNDALQTGETVVLAGFGESNPTAASGQQNGAGTLRKVDVQIQNAQFSPTEVLVNQTQGGGACHGDSGGPAFASRNGQLLLWGITSRAYPDNQAAAVDCNQGSVYTDILEQADFVNQAGQQLRGDTMNSGSEDSTGTGITTGIRHRRK